MNEEKHRFHPSDTMHVGKFSLSEPTTRTFVVTTPSDAAMAAAKEIEKSIHHGAVIRGEAPTVEKRDMLTRCIAEIIDDHFAPLREELAAANDLAEMRGDSIDVLFMDRETLHAENAKLRAALQELFVAAENAGEIVEDFAEFAHRTSSIHAHYEALRVAILSIRRSGLIDPKPALP